MRLLFSMKHVPGARRQIGEGRKAASATVGFRRVATGRAHFFCHVIEAVIGEKVIITCRTFNS